MLAALGGSLLLASCVNAPHHTHTDLERFRQSGAGTELAGVAIAELLPNGQLLTAAAGCAQFLPDGQHCRSALTPDTLLRAASISKLATTLAVMRLREQGKLDLDRDVSDYLGFTLRNPAFPARAITLRQLLAHSSSLIDGDIYWAPHPQTLQQLISSAPHFDALHAPGACYRYTNLNFGVVGSILERATGERFDQLMQRLVFGPAGIEAGFNWSGLTNLPAARIGAIWQRSDARPDAPWRASVDDFRGGPAQLTVLRIAATLPSAAAAAVNDDGTVRSAAPTDYVIGSNGTLFSPQGGMRISVRGLIALGQQLLPAAQTPGLRRLLSDASLEQMLAPASAAVPLPDCESGAQPAARIYALGAEVLHFEGPTGPAWTGHFGEAYGLRSMVLADRATGRVRAYLINGSAQPLREAQPPYPGLNEAEAALLQTWPFQ